MVESKFFEKCTSRVAAVGHGVRGGANGRLYWPVGPSPHGGRIPSVVARGGRSPSVVLHGGNTLAPWATTAAPRLSKRPSPAVGPSLTPPSLL
jgi:hypothetical protein